MIKSFLGAMSMLLLGMVLLGATQMNPAVAETLIERGSYLVNTIGTCVNCHTPRGGPMKGKLLAGGNKFGGPKAPFTAFSSNITPDKETGIGNWTDTQIISAIREGVRHDGTIVGPPMAIELYRGISDTDVKAIVAYLRTVEPVNHKVKKSTYRIPLHKGKSAGHVADVPRTNLVEYGRYLAGPVGHCIECHTPQVRGRFDYKNKLGAGGRTFRGPWGVSVSSNITPTGLKNWSDDQIKTMITRGVRPGGLRMKGPMGYHLYAKMTAEDIASVIAYLRSLPPK